MRKRISAIIKVSAAGFALLFTVILSTIALSGVAHAEPSDTEIMKKTLINAMTWCYQQPGYIESPISSEDVFFIGNVVHQEGKITVPTNIGNSLNNDTINCQQVFLGVQGFLSTKMEGLLALYNKNESTVRPANLGYVEAENAVSTGYKCFNLKYYLLSAPNYTTGNYYTSNSLCLPVDADGNIRMDNYQAVTTENDSNVTSAVGSLRLRYDEWYSCIGYYSTPPSANETFAFDSGHGCLAYPKDGESFDDFINDVKESVDYPGLSATLYLGDEWVNLYTFNQAASTTVNVHNGAGGDYVSVLELENISGMVVAQLTALRWLTGNNEDYITRYTFNSNDWFYIYKTYVNRLLDSRDITLGEDCTTNKNKFTYAMTYDGKNWCEVVGAENVTGEFAGKNGTKYLTLKSFTDILNDLKNLDFDEVDDDALSDGPLQDIIGGSNGNNGVSAAEDPCYKAGASLGWIICPVIDIVSNTLKGVYDAMIKPFLEIKSSWLEAGSSQGVYFGWSAFRNFANIIFAILFLIVIFSQVTGFGLDNYGIKKVLPRLIMVAVLVNISFILCQLAVDVSNLLGSALQGLFEGLANRIDIPTVEGFTAKGSWFSLSGIVSSILTTLFVSGTVAALVVSWEVWLIPFLLALLGCVIGVIFFFIILGVRQAGVLILVALSPIAIVCYALPNTKSLFDRWKKMFEALLIVYPICGVLIGGGQFASAMLIAAGQTEDGINFFYALVAMLISVVPFFFIPSLLRGAMAAMGNIGMKIAGFGSRFGTGIKRAIYGSEGGKEWQRQFNMRNARRTFERLDARAADGKLGKIGMRRRGNAALRYNRLAMEDFKAGGNQELLLPGSRGWQKLETEQMVADTKGQRDLYGAQLNTGDARAVGEEYEKQLEALQANPNDRSAFVKVRALQDILSESDPGRSEIRNRMLKMAQKYSSVYQGLTDGTGSALSMAAGHLMDNYNGMLKKSNRGTWSMLGHFQGGDFTPLFNNGGIQTIQGADGSTSYNSSFYSQLGLSGYNAMSLIEADDDVRDGINRGIADGSISGVDKANIVSLASEAYGNQNVHFQTKVARQVRDTIINGSNPATIGSMDAGALSRLAGDIGKGTLSSDQTMTLASKAHAALTSHAVTNAAQAEQLNNILKAANITGLEPVALDGWLVTRDQDADSGSINLRGGATGGRTASGIVMPDGQTLDGIGAMLRQDQAKDMIRKANDRKFKGK